MKAPLLLLAASALVSAAAPRGHALHGYTFDAYAKDFGKEYSAQERPMRQAAFEENLAAILRQNANPSATWSAGVNHMTDYTAAERKGMNGYAKPLAMARRAADIAAGKNEYVEAAKRGLRMTPNRNYPRDFTWRNRGVISAIKDQGHCGSCWAFASTATLESHVAIATGGLPDLSEQQLVSCAPNPDACGGWGGCAGSIPELAYGYLMKAAGQASAFTYPYESYWGNSNGTCHYNPRAGGTPAAALVEDFVRVPSNDADALMEALFVGPVAVSVDATVWHTYEGGIFTGCSTTDSDIDHVVVLTGYGFDEKLNMGFWEIRNSWSPAWGEHGFIRIPRAVNGAAEHCNIDTSPQDGTGCNGGPANVTVCGACGVLYDPVYPVGTRLA